VDEARKILGFDGPDYKDRFATARRFKQIQAAKLAAAGNNEAEAAAAATPAAATSATSTTTAPIGSAPSVTATNAAASEPGTAPAAGAGGKKRKSSTSSTSSSSGGLGGDGLGEDPLKKKKKKKKKKRMLEPDDGLIHYTDLLRKYPLKSAFSTSTNAAGFLSERLPTTTHNHQPHPSASASSSSSLSSSSSKPKTIHNAPWIHAKVLTHILFRKQKYSTFSFPIFTEKRRATQLYFSPSFHSLSIWPIHPILSSSALYRSKRSSSNPSTRASPP